MNLPSFRLWFLDRLLKVAAKFSMTGTVLALIGKKPCCLSTSPQYICVCVCGPRVG